MASTQPRRPIRFPSGLALSWTVALSLAVSSTLLAADLPSAHVSFRNDVMAVLSKGGCNSGPCHGNQNGKAGFKLSLRGEDAAFDFQALTRDLFARRVDCTDPEQSLLLLKPTAQLAHEGGQRFRSDSPEFRILRQWIAEGAQDDAQHAPRLERLEVKPTESVLIEPDKSAQIAVRAMWADGRTTEVTSLAVYDPASPLIKVSHDGLVTAEPPTETTVLVRFLEQQVPVRLAFVPARPDFAWHGPAPRNLIDEQIFAKLRQLRMNPSALCADHEFIRRATLDVTGLLPTAEEARHFVADRRRDKRARWIDTLLERPAFAEFWALKWSDVLRNEEKALDRKGVQLYYDWIRRNVAANRPLDEFVRDVLSAQGSTYLNPAANFYRATRDPLTRAEAAAQLFLGTRLQCARCHNHPFDRWTQADYYDWADNFARIQYKVIENRKNDGLDSHEFIGEQIVYVARSGAVTNPRTGKPARARFLGTHASSPTPAARDAGSGGPAEETDLRPALEELAKWLTAQPEFARAQVNWVWFHLLGRGIVDPIDDFRPTNPPSHPLLLERLAADFASQGYDLRRLIRTIMNSRTYQLSSEPTADNREDSLNFSHAIPRRLSAEQLLDAQHQALGVPVRFQGYPAGIRAAQLPGGSPVRRNELRMAGAEKFLAMFGKPARLLACECERSSETTLGQTFQLISSPEIQELLSRKDNLLTALLNSERSATELATELYWTILSRAPSAGELRSAETMLAVETNRRAAAEDLAWALLNAKEFVLRK
jgi:hypothetical protein